MYMYTQYENIYRSVTMNGSLFQYVKKHVFLAIKILKN